MSATGVGDSHDQKAQAEKLITWASVAYGFGFSVVLLHTARLGVPVLELLKPIYILVGLPLSLLAYFSRRVVDWLRTNLRRNRDALVAALKTKYSSDEEVPEEIVTKMLDSTLQVLPWYFPKILSRAIFTRLIDSARDPQVKDEKQKRGRRDPSLLRLVEGYQRILNAWRPAKSLINIGVLLVVSAALVILYVWEIYPRVPMACGGGAPVRVLLLVDEAKLPPAVASMTKTPQTTTRSGAALSGQIELLYITSTAYLVRTRDGVVMSLDKSLVNGIVYGDSR